MMAGLQQQTNLQLSAALLAGGLSKRMGRDKALLDWNGEPLWAHQMNVLRALGASRILVSGGNDLPLAGDQSVADIYPGRGPLAGVHAALETITTPWLVLLAVDMPFAAPALRVLIDESMRSGCGTVAQLPGGLEPLAAVYPRAGLEIARQRLSGPDWSMHGFIQELVELGLIKVLLPDPALATAFKNLNSPEDLT